MTHPISPLHVGIEPEVAEKIRRAYERAAPRVVRHFWAHRRESVYDVGGACLFWSAFGSEELDREGIKTILQAGTMNWRIVPRGREAEVGQDACTAFGYKFNLEDRRSLDLVLADGSMPECHVWLACCESNAEPFIIDFSTGQLRSAMDAHLVEGRTMLVEINSTRSAVDRIEVKKSFNWLSPPPPTYLAYRERKDYADDVDGHVFHYEPHPIACAMMACVLRKLTPECRAPAMWEVPDKLEPIYSRGLDVYIRVASKAQGRPINF